MYIQDINMTKCESWSLVFNVNLALIHTHTPMRPIISDETIALLHVYLTNKGILF